MSRHPLGEASIEEMRTHRFPDPRDQRRVSGLEQTTLELSEGGRYPVVFDNSFGNGIFQMCNQLMGYDRFLVALALREKRAFWLLDKIVEMKMELWEEVLSRAGEHIDIVKELDDMGTQLDSFISPDMYRSDIKPRLAKLVEFIKAKAPHVRMMMHSCGSVQDVIDETRRQLDILMPGGGFVFAQVHTIQWGVPVENVVAMWDTVREHGVYH